MRDVEETALAFDRAARAAGVRYAFIGGIAVMAWGQPRATVDVDALVELPRTLIPGLVEALSAEGLTVDARDLQDALDEGGHVSVFDGRSNFHIDAKLARLPGEIEQIARAEEVPFRTGHIRIASPEETVAYKLVFGSPQDLQDARSILIRQEGRLDMGRLLGLARQLGVERALDALLKL